MNQILLTNELKKDKKNDNNKNNSKDLKKIILFFSIVIMAFGLAISGVYGYKILNKNKKETEQSVGEPQLSLEEAGNDITIIAKSDVGINKIIYTWNEDEPIEVEMNGRTSHEEKISALGGKNTLKVKVIDLNNKEIETTKEFNYEKPVIATEIGEDAKLKITATDETGIKNIKYKWNDEEFTVVEAESETEKTIETKIEVRRGQNTLTVVAVNLNDNEETKTEMFNGVNKPIIKVVKRGSELYMKMSHDMGFEKVEFTVNGKVYKYDQNYSGYDANQKELEYKFTLKEGENKVIIFAVSTEGTEETYKGKCNYTSAQ